VDGDRVARIETSREYVVKQDGERKPEFCPICCTVCLKADSLTLRIYERSRAVFLHEIACQTTQFGRCNRHAGHRFAPSRDFEHTEVSIPLNNRAAGNGVELNLATA
jgi:hypothetical protein